LGYDPNLFSTNGDGISDLLNYQSGYKGDNYNISGSTLTNAQLIAQGIDPFLPYSPPSPPTPGNGSGPVITVLLPTNAQPSP
jgi:hypothetical protein